MAAVLPTAYLSMNHIKAWKLTLSTIVAAVVVEYAIILLLYQTTCTKFNKDFILTFHKFNFDIDRIEFKEKPATMWAHATSGVIPLSVKFAVFLWKKKRFQGRRIRNNVVVPLYQCKESNRKAFLNISEYIQKNFNPVQVTNERVIDLVDTDKGGLNKSINQIDNKKKFNEKGFGNKSDQDREAIELGIMSQKENCDKTPTKPSFSYTFIDEKKKITCDKPDITKDENDSCNSILGLDQPELKDLRGSLASCSLEPRREIEHFRIPSTNSCGSAGKQKSVKY